jgi:hypothetical protein
MSKQISLLAAVMVAMLASPASAASSDVNAVKSVVRDAFAKGNSGGDPLAMFEANGSIIDEFAPYAWGKPADWVAAAGPYFSQNAITAPKTRLVGFRHVNVADGRAYAVVSVAFSYKQNGKTHSEQGLEVMTLKKGDKGWRFDSFAWVGRAGVDAGADATAIIAAVQDFASLKNAPSPDPAAIVDEFAPYAWNGTSASADWYAGLQKFVADTHSSDMRITPAAPSQLSINGDHAYATFPTVISGQENGKAFREKGSFAFALAKTGGAWHIASWAWATE